MVCTFSVWSRIKLIKVLHTDPYIALPINMLNTVLDPREQVDPHKTSSFNVRDEYSILPAEAADDSRPPAGLQIAVNGVVYSLDVLINWLEGYETGGPNDSISRVSLGVPFFQSIFVYVTQDILRNTQWTNNWFVSAYRFPTEDCPKPYFGFAFKKNRNNTLAQVNQKPRSTPTSSAQCLSFKTPTATPTISTAMPQESFLYHGNYPVVGNPNMRVPLVSPERLFSKAWATPTPPNGAWVSSHCENASNFLCG